MRHMVASCDLLIKANWYPKLTEMFLFYYLSSTLVKLSYSSAGFLSLAVHLF